MPLRWRKRPQQAPSPFVEDEVDSLSREMNGTSHLGELPGFEGAKARGTIDQSPLILDVEIVFYSNSSSNDEEKASHGSRSSGFYANPPSPKPETKQEPKRNPLRHPSGESQSQGPGKPRPRSPSKPQDTLPKGELPMPDQKIVPEVQKSFSGTSQSPVHRQPEPPTRGSSTRVDALPPKPMPDVTQKSQNVPSRTPSMSRGRDQYKPGSTAVPHPEPVQTAGVRGNALPPNQTPEVAQKVQTVPSRTSSVRRETQHKPSPTTISPQSKPARGTGVRADVLPPGSVPDVAQRAQSVPSRDLPLSSEKQHRSSSTAPRQPVPVRDSGVRGYAPPPNRMPDATYQSQPASRPLPVLLDDGQQRPRSSTVTHRPEATVRDFNVRIENLPARSLPDLTQKSQTTSHPPSVSSAKGGYKSFPSTIPPPKPLPEMQQKSQTTPLLPLPNPPTEGPRISSSSTVKRSGSLKHGHPPKPISVYPRPTTTQHASGSTAIARTHDSSSLNHSPTRQADRTSPPSPGMSVAERLEEKIKLRREQRETEDCSQPVAQEHSVQLMTSVSPVSKSPERPVPSTQPPGAWPSDLPSDLPSDSSSSHLSQFPTLEKTTEEAKPQAPTAAPLKSALRSQSLERTQSAPAQQTRRRTVSFAEKPLELPSQALVKIDHEDSLMPVQPRQDGSPESSRSTSPNSGLTLSPCPRSVPVAGYQDWHTIEGLEHLNICPSCVKQMRKSKFRDRITLSVPRPRTEPVRCAMSEAWARLAWMQTLNKKLDDLDLLLQITLAPSGTKSCTGRIINDQYWYHIIDSETGTYLPQFNVCSACVRNIRLLMPAHRETFERCGTLHERACDFVPDSPRFIRYIDALDLAANRAEQEDAPPNLNEFLSYARRKVVLRDCRRSRLIFNTWHYMPQLPEFTVCEDCYDDIVWPLSKARHPIARQFSSAMRVLPGDKGSSSREASCQLYSPRIRAKFNDAVRRDDLPFLKWLALTRFDAEQRFRDRQDELLEDQRRGYECSGDLRKNLEDWKRYE